MKQVKKRVFHIIQIGTVDDLPSRSFDIFIVCVIFLNLFATFFATFSISEGARTAINIVEWVTVIIFTIEFLLRIWTAEYLYPNRRGVVAKLRFLISFYGLVDLLTILPAYLPLVFPSGAVAFRMFRVIRIFRLFKINAKYDAFNIITDVLKVKRRQLFSSMIMIFILMAAASLCMYGLEHEAQPEVFRNAFSGIWWSASTILTIGYGDIAPVTTVGRIMSMMISFLGVGMVAIPTGIISAGFVEQYQKIRDLEMESEEKELRFVVSKIVKEHKWCGRKVRDIVFPPQILLAVVVRGEEELVPNGDLTLEKGDLLILTAGRYVESKSLNLRELSVKEEHPFVGHEIRDLDISRLDLIVAVERKGKVLIPNGSTVIENGDRLVIYSRKKA